MQMIGNERPGKAVGPGLNEQCAQALQKIAPIVIILKDIGALDPSYHDMLQESGDVYSGLSWHEQSLAEKAS
jgi:hypothetical protein